MCGTSTRSLVSPHINSLRCLLGVGLRGEGLGIPPLLLGCHSSCYRCKSGSGEYGLLPGARLLPCSGCGRPCDYTACVPAALRECGGASDSVLDRVLQITVVPQGRARAVQTVSRRFHSAFLGKVVGAPVVIQRQVLGVGQCRKTVEVPHLQSVQFLEVVGTLVGLVTTGACVGPDSAEFRRDFAVLDKAVGMPWVCRNCGGSTVTVHRQFGSRACRSATTGADGPDCAAWS